MNKLIVAIFVIILILTLTITVDAQNEETLIKTVPNFHRTELHTYFGIPVNTEAEREVKILVNLGYTVGYSEDLKIPLWTAYRLGNVKKGEDDYYFERPPRFQTDLRTTARVTQDDYTGSGYNRGHMAPNFAIRSQYGHIAQIETFMMSNICPQKGSLNQGSWRVIEEKIAKILSQEDKADGKPVIQDLWVVSGPIFDDDKPITYIGPDNDIAVPHKFFKIIIRRKSFRKESVQGIAVVYEQEPESSTPFTYHTIDEVEGMTGFDFCPKVEDEIQNKFEKKVRDIDWNKIE
jgi:endonuclease G